MISSKPSHNVQLKEGRSQAVLVDIGIQIFERIPLSSPFKLKKSSKVIRKFTRYGDGNGPISNELL